MDTHFASPKLCITESETIVKKISCLMLVAYVGLRKYRVHKIEGSYYRFGCFSVIKMDEKFSSYAALSSCCKINSLLMMPIRIFT